MKARIGIVAITLVITMLFTGALALATDYTWDCSGICSGSWTSGSSWDPDTGYPASYFDSAIITSTSNLITYAPGAGNGVTIRDLTLAGGSPTWRKLHIKDGGLTVNGSMTLGDYAELDVDEDMSVHFSTSADTFLEGHAKIDVAENKTLELAVLTVKGANTRLHITTGATFAPNGTFSVEQIIIDAQADDAPRALKLIGGGTLTLGPNNHNIQVVSDSTGNGRAKLWVASTTLDMGDVFSTVVVKLEGGNDVGEEAELDLDRDMIFTFGGSILHCTRRVKIDIAADKELRTSEFKISANVDGAFVKLTAGSGAALKVDIN